jgi:hypothetical protein
MKKFNFTTVEELETAVENETVVLNSLKNANRKDKQIKAQERKIERLNQDLAKGKATQEKAEIKEKMDTVSLDFMVITAGVGKTARKAALVKNNRPISSKKVDEFITLISNGKYEEAYPIIVAEAERLIEMDYVVTDIKGNEIVQADAADYYVVLDGQHRVCAFTQLNAAKENHEVPNVHIKAVENVGEYLVQINNVGSSWDAKDRLSVAALTSGEEAFKAIAGLISEGFNPSTASIIICGKKLSSKVVSKVLSGKPFEATPGMKIDIQRGTKFITLCKASGMNVPQITKRYFIEGFNSFAASRNEEEAFQALGELKKHNIDYSKIKDDNSFCNELKKALETLQAA